MDFESLLISGDVSSVIESKSISISASAAVVSLTVSDLGTGNFPYSGGKT